MTRLGMLAIVVLSGCTAAVLDGGSDASSTGSDDSSPGVTSEATSGEGTTSSTPATEGSGAQGSTSSGSQWETDSADDGYATTGGCGFTCPPPPGGGSGSAACSMSFQDCNRGEKCAPRDITGLGAWNTVTCVPLAATPATLGAPCTFEGSLVSGVDSCDTNLWCSPTPDPDDDALAGTCTALCGSGQTCPGGTQCFSPGLLNVGSCEPTCDPLLADDCPQGESCMPMGFAFGCHPQTGLREVGETCLANAGSCAPGLACLESTLCGAQDERCCAALCDQAAPSCADEQPCVDYGSPLAAYANVGVCGG